MRLIEARSDILDEATDWMANNDWMSGNAAALAATQPAWKNPVRSAPRRAWASLIVCLLALVLSRGDAIAQDASTDDIVGHWQFRGTGEILEFFACGDRRCARIAALAPGERQTRDARNPSEALRGRPICGLTVIRNLRSTAARQWRRGDAYSPEDGHTYDVRLELAGEGRMEMRAAVREFPLLGSTYSLDRVTAPAACHL